jgi:hypothetical protein
MLSAFGARLTAAGAALKSRHYVLV